VCSRGKRKIGYELSATCDFACEYKSEIIEGTIEIGTMEDSCEDCPINVSCKNSELKSALNKSIGVVRAKVEEFLQEMKHQS